jgi:HAD superfamily hydrolase (TIGR01549 family)
VHEQRQSIAEGRLALFDLDNTLFDRASAYAAWCTAFVEDRQLGPEAYELLIAADQDGHAPRSAVFEPLCDQFHLSDSPSEITTRYRSEYPTYFVPEPEVQAALSSMRRRGWTVVIVTNGPPSQIDKIVRCGLDVVVDGWCISDVVGSAKPDPKIFEAAAALVGLPLDGWMIGDTSAADVVGGRSVGLQTIWLARGRVHPTEPALVADVTVETLWDAFAILEAASERLDAH